LVTNNNNKIKFNANNNPRYHRYFFNLASGFTGSSICKKFEFGCSKSYKNSLSTSYLDTQGTQGYTAPEVILNGKASQASDQFSLGAIVYEIFASQLPYQNKLDKNLIEPKFT
jgi:serine/threonine protein kinase